MNTKELIKKATFGKLLEREIDEVVRALKTNDCDPYDALLIIGRAEATQYRPLVESYVQQSDDPMLARLALQVLCRYWSLGDQYRGVLERFIRKVDWDEDDDVRLMAIDCAGSLLAAQEDWHLMSLVRDVFQDEGERQIVREAAYCALALVAGRTPDELPAASRHFDLEHGIDPAVISYVEARLSACGTDR
jgi:hypothetical protein